MKLVRETCIHIYKKLLRKKFKTQMYYLLNNSNTVVTENDTVAGPT